MPRILAASDPRVYWVKAQVERSDQLMSRSTPVTDHGDTLLIDARALARMLGISVATLHRLRSAGKIGPRPLRLGTRVLWCRATVVRWLIESERAGHVLDVHDWSARSAP